MKEASLSAEKLHDPILKLPERVGYAECTVAEFFYLADKVDVEKLGLYVGSAFESLSGYLFQVVAEHVYLGLNFLCDCELVFIQVLVDVCAYEHHALACQIKVRAIATCSDSQIQ